MTWLTPGLSAGDKYECRSCGCSFIIDRIPEDPFLAYYLGDVGDGTVSFVALLARLIAGDSMNIRRGFMKISTTLRSSGLLVITAALVLGLVYASTVRGQQFRTTVQMQNALERLETNTDRFSRSIDTALDRSRFNNTDLEDHANALVDELEFATDRLKDRVDDHIVNIHCLRLDRI
jgi:hypothetical protein